MFESRVKEARVLLGARLSLETLLGVIVEFCLRQGLPTAGPPSSAIVRKSRGTLTISEVCERRLAVNQKSGLLRRKIVLARALSPRGIRN